MEELFEILKLILPALIVFGTTFYMLKRFLEREQNEKLMEMRKKNQQTITPIRLQAYERLVLFLERISLNNLVIRTHQSGMSAKYLRDQLLSTIRDEYDHNLSQQIYISNNAWDLVSRSKEEMIKFINTEAEKLADDASGYELSKNLFDRASQVQKMPTQVALEYLKSEVRKMY